MSDELKTEHKFVLKTPLSYARGGEQYEATFIELTAPTSRNSRQCAALKQAFFRAANRETHGGGDAPEDVEITGHDVLSMMAMSNDVNLPDVLDVAIELFTKGGVAKVDGEVKLTQHLVDHMSQDDLEEMLGEYLVNFTLASSLARMREKS